MCQCLRAGHSLVGVVAQKLPNNVNTLTRDMLQVFLNPSPRLHRELEIKLHVGVLLEPLENPLVRRAQNLVDFVDLVYLSFAREKRLERQHFVENAPHAPYVHLVIVHPFGHQALGRAIPSRGHVLSVLFIRIFDNILTRPEVRELDPAILEENIFGLNVTMKQPIRMHVIQCFQQLKHVQFHLFLF